MSDRLDRHLAAGECILWIGHPAPGIWFNRADRLLVPFSLVWGGMSIGFFYIALRQGSTNIPRIAVLGLFSILGVYLIIGRLLVRPWTHKKTTYALTDQRALVIRDYAGWSMDEQSLDDIPVLQTVRSGTNRYSIQFGHGSWWIPPYGSTGLEILGAVPRMGPIAFLDLSADDKDMVLSLLRQERRDP